LRRLRVRILLRGRRPAVSVGREIAVDFATKSPPNEAGYAIKSVIKLQARQR